MSDQFYIHLALWSQVAGSLVFFVLIVVLWNRFIAPAVTASQIRKNGELAEAERRRDEAKATVTTAQAELAAADQDVASINQRSAADAARERERIIAGARAEGEQLVKQADGELERSRYAARQVLRAELIERAMQIARERAANIPPETDRRLVGDAIAALGAGESR